VRVLLLPALLLAGVPADNGPVVVVPPEGPLGDSAWIAQAVADALPLSLARLGVPAVERTDRQRAQESLGIPAEATTTRASGIRVAEVLDASRLVVGSYELRGADVVLSLRLLDLARATLSAPLLASGPQETLPTLVSTLAWDIALAAERPPAGPREAFVAAGAAVPFPAFRAHAEALAASDPAARVKLVRRALSLAPDYDEARLDLGRLLLQTRDFAGAQEALLRIGPASPLARSARFLRGVALLELGRYREAGELFTALSEEAPSPAVLNNRALGALRLPGPPGRASAFLREAVEKEPGSTDLRFNLGWACLLEGDAEAAVFWMRSVVGREARENHARLVLTWALAKAGRPAESEEEWRALSAVSSSYQALQAPDLTRRFERIQVSERLITADGDQRSEAELAATHLARADKLEDAGDLEGALGELMRAAYLDPYGARVHRQLARVHRRRGDTDKAVAEMRMSLWCRDDVALRLELAGLLSSAGRPAEAKAEARRVLAADPSNGEARRLADAP
jgi:tetratricopeptide (TPR) repeat protein